MAIMCPILSRPQVAEKFNQIKDVVGEVGAYDIWSKNNGNSIDMAPNGEPSILFQDLLKIHGGMIAGAIASKAKIFTKQFLSKFGDWFNMDTVFQDENREPLSGMIEKHIPEDLLDYYVNFVSKLRITKGKLRKQQDTDNYSNFLIRYNDYVRDLLGVDLFSSGELNGVQEGDISLDDVYNRIDYICQNLQPVLQEKISEYKKQLDNSSVYGDWYVQNMLSFLRKHTTDISDYDIITQQRIRQFFPNLFKADVTEAQLNKYFGHYKHQLMSQKGKAYTAIQLFIEGHNLHKMALQQKYNKLQRIKQIVDIKPNVSDKIKNKLYNQFVKHASIYDSSLAKNSRAVYENARDSAIFEDKYDIDFVTGLLKKENSLSNLVNIIYNFTPEGKQKTYIGSLLSTLKRYTNGKVYFFKFNEQYESIGGVCSYDEDGQVISLNNNVRSYTHISNIIIHEAVHYVTSRYIDEHPKIKAVLRGYVDYLNAYDNANKSRYFSMLDVYGLKNEHEFIAEFVSNPNFRELLKYIPAYDENKFNNALENVVSVIDNSIHKNSQSQIESIVLQILDNNGYTFDQSQEITKQAISKYADDSINVDELLDSESTESESQQDTETETILTKLSQTEDDFVVEAIKERLEEDPNTDIMQAVEDARYKFAEQQQSKIMQSTQLRLAAAFGLHRQSDGTWKTADGKDSLLVQFFEYLDDANGYYDYNTKSTMAHHIIGIALNSADPSTFNHEMAHHYLRMFWRSKLVQEALRAVNKEGMTDEEREEALVDLLTMKTMDNQFMDYANNDSFFAHFWTRFGSMLYKTFKIRNSLTRNALLNNMAIAFAINEQQKMNEKERLLFKMADQRMFKKKDIKALMKEAKHEGIQARNNPEYQAILGDKVQSAIKNIITGTISRNKSYRKTQENPITLMNMQLAEEEVRKFVEGIRVQREAFVKDLNKKRLSYQDKRDMSHTGGEIDLNVKLITRFAERAFDEIEEMINILRAAELGKYKQLCYREIVNPNTGETRIQYLDISEQGKEGVQDKEITFKDLQEYKQNTIEFYRNVISKLNRALSDPTFELYYGKEVKQHLLDMLKGTQSQIGIESIIADCEQLYENAISKQIYAFVDDYVDKNVNLSTDLKERMKYSMHTWIEDQNVFGDMNVFQVFVGLTQHVNSPVIRMLGDIINTITNDRNNEVKKRGTELNILRKKAIAANGGKWKELITNVEKLFMEKDENGFTGNWVTEINYGKFYGELNKFLNVILQGKDGIEQQIADRLGNKDYELQFDDDGQIMFPDGCEDIEKKYRHKLNDWYATHCVRRFTKAYYDKRIDMLSSVTLKAQEQIDRDINAIRKSLPEGPTRTDLLPISKQRELIRLERQKAQLSSIYDSNGNEKEIGTVERKIADELSAWQMFIKDKVAYKLDEESYKAAYEHAANKQLFEQNNTYLAVNPKIWDEIAKIFGNRTSEVLEDLQNKRRKLMSLIKLKGISYPNIEKVFDLENGKIRDGYEPFFENLKKLDEQISKERYKISKGNKVSKDQAERYAELLGKISAQYEDKFGLKTPWIQKIEQSIRIRIEREHPNDPNNGLRVQQEIAKFMFKDVNDNTLKPLSIFTITAPKASKVSIDGKWIDSLVKQPTQLYSKLDAENSDPNWVDTRFDETSKVTMQPFTDNTIGRGSVSYTNPIAQQIAKNEDLNNYYTKLMETMQEAWSNIGFLHEYDNRLPQIGATSRQFGWRHPFSILKNGAYMFSRNFSITEVDTDVNSDFELRPDGTRSMNVPVRYIQRLADPTSITGDVFGSVMKFYEMSLNYKYKTKMLPLFQTIYNKLKSNDSLHTGQRDFLRGMINRQFYDRKRNFDFDDNNPAVYNDKQSKFFLKIVPKIKSLSQTGLLALSMIPGIINWIDPAISIAVEAIAGKYMTPWEYVSGTFAGICAVPSMIAGIGSAQSYSIGNGYSMIPTAMNYFNVHNEGAIQYNRADKTILNKMFTFDMLMCPFSLGEYMIGAQCTAITFQQYRYYNGKYYRRDQFIQEMVSTGQMTREEAIDEFKRMRSHTLFSAYKAENGTLVKRDNEYGKAIDEKTEMDIQKYLQNRIQTYLLKPSATETTKMQSNLLSSMVLIMRTFMIAGIWDRWKGGRDFQIEDDTLYEENEQKANRKKLSKEYARDIGMYNFQSGMIESGATRRALDALIHLFSKSTDYKYLRYLKWAATHPFTSQYAQETADMRDKLNIADVDVYSAKRLATEMTIIIALMGASIAFHNKVALDNPDDWKIQLIDLILMRLGIERMTMLNPDTLLDIITSITAASSDWDKKGYIINVFKDIAYYIKHKEWETVKGYGTYQHKPKIFRDLMYTLNSLGTHNVWSTLSIIGLKQKLKWYTKISPVKDFYTNVKEAKEKRQRIKENGGYEIIDTRLPGV